MAIQTLTANASGAAVATADLQINWGVMDASIVGLANATAVELDTVESHVQLQAAVTGIAVVDADLGTASALGAGTIYVAFTYATIGPDGLSGCGPGEGASGLSGLGGETLESPAASLVIAQGDNVKVTAPAFPSNLYGLPVRIMNVYAGTSADVLYYQGSSDTNVYTISASLLTDTLRAPSQRYSREAPTLSKSAGDSGLDPGTMYVRHVWVTAQGPMWFSDLAQIGVVADDVVHVQIPAFPQGVIAALIFMGYDQNDLTLQWRIENPWSEADVSAGEISTVADDFNRAQSSSMGGQWLKNNADNGYNWHIFSDQNAINESNIGTAYPEIAYWDHEAGISDCEVEADCRSDVSGDDYETIIGVVARYDPDNDNWYEFVLYRLDTPLPGGPTELWYLRRVDAGVPTTVDSGVFAQANQTNYRMKLVAEGASLKGYIDGALVTSQTDANHTSGKVGIVGGAEAAAPYGPNVRLDNFLARNLDALRSVYDHVTGLCGGLPMPTNRTSYAKCGGIFQYQPVGFMGLCALSRLVAMFGDSIFLQKGSRLKNILSDRTPQRKYRAIQANDTLLIVNGKDDNQVLEGETIRDMGLTTPQKPQVVASASGQLSTDTGYTYHTRWVRKSTNGTVITKSPMSPASDDTGPLSNNAVQVTWETPPANATHVEVYRNLEGGATWYRIAQVASTNTDYTDNTPDLEVGTYEADFDTDEPPIFTDIAWWKGRAWGLSGLELFHSVLSEDGQDAEAFDTENALLMETNGRNIPISLDRYHDDLVVHLEDGIFKISGFSDLNFRQRQIYTTVGCIARGGSVNNDAFQLFLSSYGIYVMAGDEVKYAGEKVEKTWGGLNKRQAMRDWWHGVRYQAEGKDQILFPVSTASSDKNDIALVYDQYTGKMSIFGGFLWDLSQMAIIEDTTGRERLYRGDYAGGVWIHDVRGTDHCLPIEFRYRTQPYTRGQLISRQQRLLYIYHRKTAGTLWVDTYKNLSKTPFGTAPRPVDLKGSLESLWDSAVYGDDVWGGEEQDEYRTRFHLGSGASHRIQFEFKQTADLMMSSKLRDMTAVISGWAVLGRDRSVR